MPGGPLDRLQLTPSRRVPEGLGSAIRTRLEALMRSGSTGGTVNKIPLGPEGQEGWTGTPWGYKLAPAPGFRSNMPVMKPRTMTNPITGEEITPQYNMPVMKPRPRSDLMPGGVAEIAKERMRAMGTPLSPGIAAQLMRKGLFGRRQNGSQV